MTKKIIEGTFHTDWSDKEKFLYEENQNINAQSHADPNMICFEVYNNSGFDVEFHSQLSSDIGTNYLLIRVKNDDFAILPHGYYVARGLEKNGKSYLPNGTPLSILKNYGDMKFKGNKKASINTTVME